MIKQQGTKLKDFPFKFTLFYHILYHDGPILSHVKDEDGVDYLAQWVDDSKSANRWLIFKVEPIDLKGYLSGKVGLQDLIFSPKNDFVYLTDLADDKYTNTMLLKATNLVDEYLPGPDLFYLLEMPDEYETLFAVKPTLCKEKLMENNFKYTAKKYKTVLPFIGVIKTQGNLLHIGV